MLVKTKKFKWLIYWMSHNDMLLVNKNMTEEDIGEECNTNNIEPFQWCSILVPQIYGLYFTYTIFLLIISHHMYMPVVDFMSFTSLVKHKNDHDKWLDTNVHNTHGRMDLKYIYNNKINYINIGVWVLAQYLLLTHACTKEIEKK